MFRNTAMGQDHIYSRTAQDLWLLDSWPLTWHPGPWSLSHTLNKTVWVWGIKTSDTFKSWKLNKLWDAMFRIWNMWFPWADIATRPCADAPQLGSASILKRSSNPLWRRFRRWTQSYLESNIFPKSPNSENAGTDGIWWGFHAWQYNFKISQIWITFWNSFALCASVVTTFMYGSAEKIYQSHILRTATITRTSNTRSLTVQAQNLYAKSFQKTSLEWCKIPPISARSCGMIVWDHQHFTRSLGSRSLSYCMCYAKTVRGSRGHVCAAPAVQNWRSRLMPCHMDERIYDASHQEKPRSLQVDPINPCHAKPRSWTTLTATTPPAPAYTSRNPLTATTLFGKVFCWKIPEKDVTKAWWKVMWNGTDDGSQLANQMRKVIYFSRFLTNFWPTGFSPAKFSLPNFSPIQTSRPHTSHPQTSHKQTSIYLKSPQCIPTITIFVSLHALFSSPIL